MLFDLVHVIYLHRLLLLLDGLFHLVLKCFLLVLVILKRLDWLIGFETGLLILHSLLLICLLQDTLVAMNLPLQVLFEIIHTILDVHLLNDRRRVPGWVSPSVVGCIHSSPILPSLIHPYLIHCDLLNLIDCWHLFGHFIVLLIILGVVISSGFRFVAVDRLRSIVLLIDIVLT